MKSIIAPLFLLFCLCLGTAQARSTINGFQGMEWGSPLTELQQSRQLALTKENDGSGGSLYALLNGDMHFGKATLSGIHCSFVQGRLQGVILLYSGSKNYQAVKAEATSRYGKAIQVEQQGGEMFTWPDEQTSIVLSFTKNSESGFLFLKPKKLPAMAKTPQAPAPSTPQEPPSAPPAPAPQQPAAMDDLELFDQASVPQQIPVEPSPGAFPDEQAPYSGGSETDGAAAIPLVSPEVQGLIDRDQALTRLCWDTVGPVADQACEDMKENVRQLQGLGWCMKPGDARDGLQVAWYRCGSGPADVPSSPPPAASMTQAGIPAAAAQPVNPNARICSLVVDLFTAAANMRDGGTTPQDAEGLLMRHQQGRLQQLPIELIRETVELVYFDQQYSTLPLSELTRKVEDRCLSGQGPYIQPLPQY